MPQCRNTSKNPVFKTVFFTTFVQNRSTEAISVVQEALAEGNHINVDETTPLTPFHKTPSVTIRPLLSSYS